MNLHYSTYFPSDALSAYVELYWTLESSSNCDAAWDRILPDGCVELVFNLGDPFERNHGNGKIETQPEAIVVGQMKKSVLIRPTGYARLLGVRFHPFGAFSILQTPMNELADCIISLDMVLGSGSMEIHEMLGVAHSWREGTRVLEQALLKRVSERCAVDPAVTAAAKIIGRSHGEVRISECARLSGFSERQLQRKFREQIGLSPKQFSRILRMQSLFAMSESAGGLSWSRIAASCGYFDQAHFIHEFKEFCGQSPKLFFDDDHPLSRFFVRNGPLSDSYNT